MGPTLSLIKREFTAYFLSPIAYVVLAVFLLVTGHLFYLTLNLLTETGPRGVEFPMQSMLGDEKFWLVFLFIPPLLTMRLFAEERATGTLEMLMTAPVRDWQVVFAKFVACFLFYFVLWAPTMLYWPVLMDYRGVIVTWSHSMPRLAVALGLPLVALLLLLLPLPNMARHWLGQLLMFAPIILAMYVFDLPWFKALLPAGVDSPDAATRLTWRLGIILGPAIVFFGLPYLVTRASGATADSSNSIALCVVFIFWLIAGFTIAGVNIQLDSGIDPRPIATSYVGAILAGAMFLSMGLFVSSLVRSQMVAALVSLIISLPFIVAGFWRPEMDPSDLGYRILFYFSVPLHFHRDFARGIFDIGHVVLYVSLTLFFLFMTVRSLESKRWK